MYDVITIGSATRDVFLKNGFKAKADKLCFEIGSKNEVENIFLQLVEEGQMQLQPLLIWDLELLV